MDLTLNQIKEIVTGAPRIEETVDGISFYRFTKEQDEMYKERSADFHNKSLGSAGIKLLFKTDSENLDLKITVSKGSSRKYFSVDVFSNGSPIGYLDNFSDVVLPEIYTTADLPLGTFSKSFKLQAGTKTICIHLPWSVITVINKISLDDRAFIEAVKPSKKLLAFGDSITHGYDALRPSNRYIRKLADALCAEEYNKAIGGEVFCPALATMPENFTPDYITVAYGTNDWSTKEEEIFIENCKDFYTNLSKLYPNSKIFAITPIWRKDYRDFRNFGDFMSVEENIKSLTANLNNVTVISGFDLVPEDEKYFADKYLHPTDRGFDFYAENLISKIKKEL